MTTLNDRHKQLLFDYSLGLTSESENDEVEALIAANEEAVELYQSIQTTLAPLDTVEVEPCPDELTERLFARMRESASCDGGHSLDPSIPVEPFGIRTIRIPLWRNWTEVLAAAAAILVFVSVLFPAVGHMRGRAWQAQCGGNLAGIYGGFRSYVSDHDGLLPSVAMTPGAPWYRVGHQGNENQSNTRQIWLLPKLGYVDPSRFLCPGRSDSRKLPFDGFNAQTFADFPSRTHILYSIRIPCPTSNHRDLMRKGVLLADRNPLAEEFPLDPSAVLRLQLCEKMMKSNSRNHAGRGQNALMYDGSVEFTKTRYTSLSDDDIYILQGMRCGTEIRGCELPDSDLDIFLAP
ncbi:MAG TPA: hypothetical protein VLI39_18960 [Sedimentisphaerales bacterium]|nr:hypothetical protein [Sedimentisphaerales bacterium]